MSRIEKSIIKKSKRRKFRFITKVMFILCMAFNLVVCIYIVDSSAKNLLGEETSYKQINLNEVQVLVNKGIENINKNIVNIIQQFNK
ncbi:MAG: hypothetical protein ACRC92_09420 [Peptostreptococcaceae bacterium]